MKLKDLKLAASCCPQKDIRYYLNHFRIDRQSITASDGYRLVKVEFETPIDFPETIEKEYILVPYNTGANLLKKFSVKQHYLPVEIVAGLYPNQYALSCAGELEFFSPDLESKYSDFTKLIATVNENPDASVFSQYNWEYVAIAQKALIAWSGVSTFAFHSLDKMGWFKLDTAVYIIMYWRV